GAVAAVSVSAGTFSGAASGAGAVTTNTIANFVEATITDSASRTDDAIKAGTGVNVHATDTASITATTVSVDASIALGFSEGGVTVGVAIGAALADNLVCNQVVASIDQSTVDSGGTVDVKAESNNTFSASTVAVAVSVAIQVSEEPISIAAAGAG